MHFLWTIGLFRSTFWRFDVQLHVAFFVRTSVDGGISASSHEYVCISEEMRAQTGGFTGKYETEELVRLLPLGDLSIRHAEISHKLHQHIG